jgi:benzoyl-CoA reductase subunit C
VTGVTVRAVEGAYKSSVDNLERTFDKCGRLLEDIHFTAIRDWKQANSGRKVVAYFPVYAPLELVHAAGMLPVGVSGAGDRLDIQHADARFGSFICSIVKTTLEMGLTGHLQPFDAFLFSTICDSARNLCFVMKRNFPEMYLDFIHLPHNPGSPATPPFLAEEYRRILAGLEQMGGKQITDDEIRNSIVLYNRNRALIRELYQLRAREPHLVRAWESYVLVRAGNFLPVEEHTAMLEDALPRLRARDAKKRDSIRIVVEGSFCEQPPLVLIRMIEEAGCYIVADDFTIGQSWFHDDVPTDGDPVLALAQSYVDRAVYSSVRHDFRRPRWDGLVEKVKAAHADAVLFLIAKFCEPAYFDYVPYRQELERVGIPHLQLEFEEKLFTFDRVRTEIETFVESLVFD